MLPTPTCLTVRLFIVMTCIIDPSASSTFLFIFSWKGCSSVPEGLLTLRATLRPERQEWGGQSAVSVFLCAGHERMCVAQMKLLRAVPEKPPLQHMIGCPDSP